ncbi:MAG: DoxX family protein [Chloroflexi bacterium OLB14]|nr:MAG: DoxX family protein [Chloroflexi bacterium OLB14]MBX7049812.1 DoxX family protein [Chitinophagales bacterium]HMZ94895.1 DoxX family protein [Chitinophagales bacterium]HNJ02477.1 DoxX family protein [Chitinophagales bacterium]HNN27194.1 DoxX family protein [Chitinophagales bacterium]
MATQNSSSKALNISLWVAQGILAAMFLMAGAMKSTQPVEQLATSLPWVTQVPVALVRFIGISEFLGAVGLLLPSILRIQPKLTVWAAIGIATIMLFALIFHASKGEFSAIGMNVVLGLIAVFVAWGRAKKVSIKPKS